MRQSTMVRSKECGIAFSKLPMRQSTSKTIGSKVALLSKLPIRQSTEMGEAVTT